MAYGAGAATGAPFSPPVGTVTLDSVGHDCVPRDGAAPAQHGCSKEAGRVALEGPCPSQGLCRGLVLDLRGYVSFLELGASCCTGALNWVCPVFCSLL